MTNFNAPRREWVVGICLGILIFCVYLAFPTRNYYWDGITFSLHIEDAHGLEPMLFNPNHLGYDTAGYAIYHLVRVVLPGIRALSVLVTINQILGALSAFLIFRILGRYTKDNYSRVCLTLLFAFSATWWKFSTDADVYVPSTFCLIVAFSLILREDRKPNLVAIGLIHALAMLFHQITVFFYIPAVTAILLSGHWKDAKEKVRSVLTYSLTAGIAVAVPYVLVWNRIVRNEMNELWDLGFVRWITANGPEEYIFQSIPVSLLKTAQSTVRVFFGGRFTMARDFVEMPILIGLCGLLIVCAGFFVVHLRRSCLKSRAETPMRMRRSDAIVYLSWAAPFLVFLLFWLTEWPYYRLFYLPAIIGILACVIERYRPASGPKRSYALAGFVGVMALSNFIFLIYPFTKAGATPPVRLALGANAVWDRDSVVFYRTITSDNRTFQYFNRQARWETVSYDVNRFKGDLCSWNSAGYKTWIDATGLDYLASFPDAETWMEGVELLNQGELINLKHRIHYMQIIPTCDQRVSIEDPVSPPLGYQ